MVLIVWLAITHYVAFYLGRMYEAMSYKKKYDELIKQVDELQRKVDFYT